MNHGPDALTGSTYLPERCYWRHDVTAVRRFVAGYDTERDATAAMHQLARVLVRCEVVHRYGVSVERLSGARVRWAVYLTDRTPDEGAPDSWQRAVMSVMLAD
ncbi:hypothetical protein [Streptomyces uncialis]|uniref:hypothetical protein n=1 Tax=Streptomyces uncialis TaxID=1048205 RepID=UPI0037B7D5E7